MSDESLPAETQDPRVDTALRDYLERLDRGEPVDRDDFLQRNPDIAGPLRSLIDAEAELRKLAGGRGPRESAGISTRSIAAPGQETVPPKLQPSLGTTGSGLAGRFGRYEIIRALGRGAMGAVYLAKDTQLERQVAIKTPHFEGDPTGELLARFYREARAAATLRNANICPVHDVGQIDGKHFISMAYIEGRSLSDLIKGSKAQNERNIVTAIRKLALALQEAHDHGIVHRDLKPSNIMVDKKGEPIVMDFGLARRRRAEGEASLTHSGDLVGSPAYMSPEQIEGDPDSVGPLSDQYSLGVVLYEMLTGQLPFRGSVINVLAQILTKEMRRPSELRTGLDPRIEAVCLKMMSKKASDRFESMKAVADQLSAIVKNPAAASINTAPSPPEKSPTASQAAAAATPAGDEARESQVRRSLKPKALTESDVASLEELVRKCLRRRDYDQAIQIIERIPENRRSESLESLLTKAREKVDEISFLVCEIDEAERLEDRRAALEKAESLLKVKPGHHRAKEIQEKYSGYSDGDGGAARISALSQFTKPWSEGGWIPWSVLAFGLAVFGAMSGVMIIYLGRTVIKIEVTDPGVEVAVKGTTLTVTGPDKQSVKVEPGDQELKITSAGLETVSTSFSLKKGEKKTVTVSIVNKEIVARLENEILPSTPNRGEKAAHAVAGTTAGTTTVDAKPKVAASPPKFFKPFLVRGEWKIENDELVQPSLASAIGDDVFPLLAFGEPALSNYDLTLDVKKTGGGNAMGIFFHWLGPRHYRTFCLEGNGGIDFHGTANGKWDNKIRQWKPLKYSSNRWYSLKVEVRDNTIRAYLDDVLQFEAPADARFTRGRICLYTQDAAARFRRIKLADPKGTVRFEGLPELPPTSEQAIPKTRIGNGSRLLTAGETAAKSAQEQWAERLKTPVISANSLEMKLALIPSSEFQMGSPKSESQRGANEQQHRVRITQPFYLGVYEITQSEFEQVMGRNPSYFSSSGGQSEKATGPDTSRNPVESVTWYDAVEFCNKLSEKEERRPYYRLADVVRESDGWIKDAKVSIEGGNGYRLPTEAQWEYACRAGTTTPFDFGTAGNGSECNCNGKLPYGIEQDGPSLGMTVPVGSYRPNTFGLYDMHGNVWEWCWDVYDAPYDKSSPSDPMGPSEGRERVHRGGCWAGSAGECRSAYRRHWNSPGSKWWEVGFRIACDATGREQFKPLDAASGVSQSSADPDRNVAEAVLKLGGSVGIRLNGGDQTIEAGKALPSQRFQLFRVLLRGGQAVSDATLGLLGTAPNLVDLSFGGAPVSDEAFVRMRNIKDLEVLNICDTHITDKGLAHLKGSRKLKYMMLEGTHITDDGLRNFDGMKQLALLWLGNTRITDAGLVHLKSLKQLWALHLGGTDITDAGLVQIADMAHLATLILSHTRVSDGGLTHLKRLKHLEDLRLDHTRISDSGLEHIRGLSKLKSLILGTTGITDVGVKKLAAALPLCKIEWDGGVIEPKPGAATTNAPSADDTLSSATDPDRRAAEAARVLGGSVSVRIDGREESIEHNAPLPAGHFDLIRVRLDGRSGLKDSDLALLGNAKNLIDLFLSDTAVTDSGLAHLEGLTNLETLFLVRTPITDAGLAHLQHLPKLNYIHLWGCTRVGDAGLSHLKDLPLKILHLYATKVSDNGMAYLEHMTDLTDLGLNDHISDAGLSHLRNLKNLGRLAGLGHVTDAGVVHLKGMSQLWGLALNGTEVSNAGLAQLTGLRELAQLNLAGTHIDDSGLIHLRAFQKLQILNLAGTRITDAGLHSLRGLTALEWLGLNNTRVSGAGLANLKGMEKLHQLDLDDSRIRNAGLEQLKNMPQLQKLRLRHTEVTDAGLHHLQDLTNLGELDLTDTKITAAGRAKLQKSIPACKILANPKTR